MENKGQIEITSKYMAESNEIVLYKPDETLALDVRVEDETVWLTQARMSELFQATKQNISLFLRREN